MRDQCARLTDLGHPAVMLASGEDNQQALDATSATAPRRSSSPRPSASPRPRSATRSRSARSRCSSSTRRTACPSGATTSGPTTCGWRSIIAELGHPPTMACTATATPKVAEEIVARLGLREPERVRSGFDRPNLSFDVLPFDGEGSVARKRATLVAGLKDPREPARRSSTAARASRPRRSRRCCRAEGLQHRRLPRGLARRRRAPARRTRSCAARPTSSSPPTRSGWASTRPTCARSGTGRCRRSLEAYYQEAGRAGRDGEPARAVLLASRSDLGRLVRFIREAEVTVEQVARARRPAAPPGRPRARPRRRPRPDPARRRRTRRSADARARRGRARPRAAQQRASSTARSVAQLCRAATDRRWQSYRSIEHYAATGDRCRRRQLLDHFGDQTPGAPLGRCCDVHDPPDWLPPITAKPEEAARRSRTARRSPTPSSRR